MAYKNVKTVSDEKINGVRVVIGEASDHVGPLAWIIALFRGGTRVHTEDLGIGDVAPHNHTYESARNRAKQVANRLTK